MSSERRAKKVDFKLRKRLLRPEGLAWGRITGVANWGSGIVAPCHFSAFTI